MLLWSAQIPQFTATSVWDLVETEGTPSGKAISWGLSGDVAGSEAISISYSGRMGYMKDTIKVVWHGVREVSVSR